MTVFKAARYTDPATCYVVSIQGWGMREEEFYDFGTFHTEQQASRHLETLLVEAELDGLDLDNVVARVEEYKAEM